MSIKSSDSFAAFVSLNRYLNLIESSKPTKKQAEEAIKFLCQIYGAENEEELIRFDDPEIIQTYKELKNKIMKDVVTE